MCQFNLPFSGDSASLVDRARIEIQKAGGHFTGDASRGSFNAKTPIGSIQGNYVVIGQEFAVTIIKKPFLLSCNRIEKELRGVMT